MYSGGKLPCAPGRKDCGRRSFRIRKSTFLRCLNLLEIPTSGDIWFDGVKITDPKVNIDKIREHMGMVFQNFNLFNNLTIMENITLAPVKLKVMGKEEAGETALKLLDRVGLKEKADAYPGQLSGGQKQRVAIVRSLAMNPKVMLLMSLHQPWIRKWWEKFWML